MKIRSLTATVLFVLLLCLFAIAQPVTRNRVLVASEGNARELYSKTCSKCHGKDGRATGLKAKAVHARNLADGQWQDRVSDERIFNSISNGKGKMPAYHKKLSEAQINDLVNYVRGLKK